MVRMSEIVKNRFQIGALILIVLGLLLIVLNEMYVTSDLWGEILNNLAAILFIAGVFEIMNELYMKEKLVDLILHKLKLKETIDKTGITEVFSDINDIDYRFYIKNSVRYIDIYHVYGRTWTNSHIETIKDKLIHSNCKVRVVLLSQNSSFIHPLAERYEIPDEELIRNIKNMEETWRRLFREKKVVKKRKTQSSLKLYYSDSFPTYSLYRFDDSIINVQSKPSKGRTISLPTIVCTDTNKGNDLYDMYLKEIEDIIQQAQEVDLN
ncbi:hypothetical protein [Psychrobacillus antarcticus]|uniref:hypothetical protein n=1 Tax=Psychrobacillus antarcticus TaxID=2879115 RepID=UPI002407FD34|nr:hypothetical protein [Psychrobacillus antarcticus]